MFCKQTVSIDFVRHSGNGQSQCVSVSNIGDGQSSFRENCCRLSKIRERRANRPARFLTVGRLVIRSAFVRESPTPIAKVYRKKSIAELGRVFQQKCIRFCPRSCHNLLKSIEQSNTLDKLNYNEGIRSQPCSPRHGTASGRFRWIHPI